MLRNGQKLDWEHPLLIALDMSQVSAAEVDHMRTVHPANPNTVNPKILTYGLAEEHQEFLRVTWLQADPLTGEPLDDDALAAVLNAAPNFKDVPRIHFIQGGQRLAAAKSLYLDSVRLALRMVECLKEGNNKMYQKLREESQNLILDSTFLAAVFPGKYKNSVPIDYLD